jgi:hypothetical protein
MTSFLEITVLVCLGYLLLTNLTYVALVVVAFMENVVRRHEHASQDYDVLGESRFTMAIDDPASSVDAIYVPASNIVNPSYRLFLFDDRMLPRDARERSNRILVPVPSTFSMRTRSWSFGVLPIRSATSWSLC